MKASEQVGEARLRFLKRFALASEPNPNGSPLPGEPLPPEPYHHPHRAKR
jgi:hypothetical protein